MPDSPEPAALWKRVGIYGQHVQGTLARGWELLLLRSGPGHSWRTQVAPGRELLVEEQEPDCHMTLNESLSFLGWFLPGLGSGWHPEAVSKEGAGQGSG